MSLTKCFICSIGLTLCINANASVLGFEFGASLEQVQKKFLTGTFNVQTNNLGVDAFYNDLEICDSDTVRLGGSFGTACDAHKFGRAFFGFDKSDNKLIKFVLAFDNSFTEKQILDSPFFKKMEPLLDGSKIEDNFKVLKTGKKDQNLFIDQANTLGLEADNPYKYAARAQTVSELENFSTLFEDLESTKHPFTLAKYYVDEDNNVYIFIPKCRPDCVVR